MIGFQEKKKIRSVIYSKLFLLVLLLILIWLIFSIFVIYKKYRVSREGADRTAAEVYDLKNRETDLQTKIDNLEKATGVENEIRNKYLMSKEGEKVIVLVEDQEATATATSGEMDTKSWWQKLKELWSE